MEHNSLEMLALYHKATECYQKPDADKHDEGFQFLLEAAENGMMQACKMLGLLYMSGQYAPYPEKDESLAVHWWRMAAQSGDEEAMFWLGQCYEDGIGVEANEEEARIWKKFAIANGFLAEGEEEEGTTPEVQNEETPAKPKKVAEIVGDKAKRKNQKKTEARVEQKKADAKVELKKTEVKLEPKSEPKSEPKVEESKPETIEDKTKTDRKKRQPQVKLVETVIQKRKFQLKEAPKKQEEEEAEAQRFAREEEEARRVSNQYRIRMGIGGAICCMLFVWIAILVVYWMCRSLLASYTWLFWTIAILISVPVIMYGYGMGVKKAQRRIDLVAEYRKSAFYHAQGCELGQMNRQQHWCYRIYRSLKKNYCPITYRKKIDLPELRGYRGCLYTNWIYQSGQDKAQPEFVVLTEKAVYVIRTAYYSGRIQGDLADTGWSLFSDGEKDLTAQRIPNLVDENARSIRIIKEDLVQYFDLPLEQIPFFNVIFFNQDVDIKGLRRMSAEEDVVIIQGLPDKLRGSLGIWESRLSTHNWGLDELVFAFEQIGRQFLKRSGW